VLSALYIKNNTFLYAFYQSENCIFYLERFTIIDNKFFYLISKIFNKLININSCYIINANKIYRDTAI